MVGSLWQGGGDWDRGELCWALHPAMTGPAVKNSCLQRSQLLKQLEFNGAESHREKLWEVFGVQDRLEDQVQGRAGTRQDSGRLGSRNPAIASWPKEPVFSTCWSTVNSSFSPCSVRSKLQVPEEGPAGQAQATVLLSGYFERGERKALANLASVLGGGHLELLSFYVTQSVPLHPQKEICVLSGWIKCVQALVVCKTTKSMTY